MFMEQEKGKKVGEVKVKTYILKNDSTLLRLEKATVRGCSLSEAEAEGRGCSELGKANGRVCEELVLIYRPSGCVREKSEVDLDEVTTVKASSVEAAKGQKD
jgi:hypothetical protein